MKIAVISCLKYRDTWGPFCELFRKFWPECPYEWSFVTDERNPLLGPDTSLSWCRVVADYAFGLADKKPVLMLQDDMFFNAPVNQSLIDRALELLDERDAAMVRLYPCPGADEEYGDAHFGRISKGARYRVSCQASIWKPEALHSIASQFNTPQEFELEGSKLSNCMDQEFLALKRDCPQPWPISYECTAIVRGKWQQSALDLCAQHGIEVDTSMREVA